MVKEIQFNNTFLQINILLVYNINHYNMLQVNVKKEQWFGSG